MPLIESVDHLTEYRRQVRARRDPNQLQVLVCGGPGCLPLGSEELAVAFQTEMAAKGLERQSPFENHRLPRSVLPRRPRSHPAPGNYLSKGHPRGCAGDRGHHPGEQGTWWNDCSTRIREPRKPCPHKAEIPFYQAQNPLVLRKLDVIDPESLDDYLAFGGYRTLRKILFQMTPEQVIDAVEQFRTARPGRRRLPHRPQMAPLPGSCRRGQIHHLQRR